MADPTHAWDLKDPNVVQNIGKLIIKLVIDGVPIPDTPAGRIQLLKDNGIEFTGDIDDVEFHQSTPRHMHLALPPKEFLQKGVNFVKDPATAGQYRVPPQYADFQLQTQDALAPEDMYNFRIGDYSLSHCT